MKNISYQVVRDGPRWWSVFFEVERNAGLESIERIFIVSLFILRPCIITPADRPIAIAIFNMPIDFNNNNNKRQLENLSILCETTNDAQNEKPEVLTKYGDSVITDLSRECVLRSRGLYCLARRSR